jgi:NADH:ubiquinone reductase (H+-translocating)
MGSSLPHARWSGVGVRPDPLTASLGLPTKGGRLVVDEHLTVPSHPEVLAGGDAAAVPDHTRPGQLTPMTAQHARRQGRRAAANLAASLGHGHRRAYRHRDLGFVVDLGGAKAVTRGYHLTAIPTNRVRIAPTGYWTPCCLSRRSISAWSAAPRSRWEAPPEPPAAQREAKPGPDEALAPADPRRTR